MKYTIITCSSTFSEVWEYTNEPNINILWTFRGHNSKVLSYIRMIWFKYNFPMRRLWLNKLIDKIGEVNIVFDSCANEYVLKWLKKLRPDKRFIFYYWNSISHTSINVENVRNIGYEIWGFDKADAKKYHYKYNPQFFCPSWYECLKNLDVPKYDISFVGRDKYKRMELADEILGTLNEKTVLTSNIYFAAPRWYLFFCNKKYKKILAFDKMLQQEMSGRILLDITDSTQCSYTLRVYDALCNKRKLITNNANIMDEKFYDKNNIFIYGLDSLESLHDFLITPFSHEKICELENMNIEHWLARFM